MTGVRYLFVAGLCLAIHIVIMILADRAGMALPIGILSSFAVVVVVGYLLHSRLTFAVACSLPAFRDYAIAMAAMLPVSAALLWLFARALDWPMPIAAPAGALATLAINFILARWSIAMRPALRGQS